MNDVYVATIEKANSILNTLLLDEKIEDLGGVQQIVQTDFVAGKQLGDFKFKKSKNQKTLTIEKLKIRKP